MRYLFGLIILSLVLLAVRPAEAQFGRLPTTIGTKIPLDIKVSRTGEEGQDESYPFRDLRGSIAVFYFWRSSNLQSVETLDQIEALQRTYRQQGVRFVSISADTEDKVHDELPDREIGFFGERLWNLTFLYRMLGAYSDPYIVIVGPQSRLLWRGLPSDRLEERLQDLIEHTKPPLGDEDRLNARLRIASRFYDQRECGRAYTIAKELFDLTDGSHSMHGRAESLMARCEQMADGMLSDAIQKENDGDLEEAARIVAEIAVRFEEPEDDDSDDNRRPSGGSSSGRPSREGNQESVQRRAEMIIGRMNGNRELKALIRVAVKEARGRLLIDNAATLEEDDYYLEAKELYEEVIEEYEDTDAAKEAKNLRRRIERDPDIRKKIDQRRARNEALLWLNIADRFAGIKLYDQARDKYQAIIKEYPDTTSATRAKERLKELPKS